MTLIDATCVLPVVNYDTSDDDVAAKKLQIQHLHIHYSFKMATHDYCHQSSNSYKMLNMVIISHSPPELWPDCQFPPLIIFHFFYFYGINSLVVVQYDVYDILICIFYLINPSSLALTSGTTIRIIRFQQIP